MERRKEFDKMHVLCALLVMLAMCGTTNAQTNMVSSVDYDKELAYYRPRIAFAEDGSHAIAWEAYRKLQDTEEWQISIQKFDPDGEISQDVIYLNDPVSCIGNESEGGRGVQNADIHFSADGQMIVAMEPVAIIDAGSVQEKRPRTIISLINQSGRVYSSGEKELCRTSFSRTSALFESDRPQISIVPGSNRYISADAAKGMDTISSSTSPFSQVNFSPGSTNRKASQGQVKYYDAWYDVATNGSLSAYSWQRCPVVNDNGDSDECDILVKFESHGRPGNMLRKTQPLKVNKGDAAGVLNYKPSIAMNKFGHSVVVWVDYRYDEQGDVLAQRFDTTGWPVGNNIRISNGKGIVDDLDGIGPEVSMLDDGSFMVVWTEKSYHQMQAIGRRFNPDGLPQANPFPLHGDPSIETGQADVTSNGSHFAYTWMSQGDEGNSIYYHIPGVEIDAKVRDQYNSKDFSLTGYPNPFFEETTLSYELTAEGYVTLTIYDLLGREVKTLVDKWQGPGAYLVNVSAEDLAVGYYVTKLRQGDFQSSKVLIRSQ